MTARHLIKPTSTRCLSARQPNPGRRSTYRRGKSVQTTGTTSVNRALIYATGGAAFTNIKPSLAALPFGGGTEPGWTAGAGVEFAMTNSWTVKAEYLYAKFQNATCAVSSCGPAAPTTVSFNENMVRVGVNYLFNY